MKKSNGNNKRTPRFVAQTLVVSIIMGTAVPTSGLGRVVYAEELNPDQLKQEAVEVVEITKEEIVNAVEEIKEKLTDEQKTMFESAKQEVEKEIVDNLEIDKEALETAKKEAEAGTQAVTTVGQNIISSEALGIVNQVQAKQDIEKAENALANGEQKVDEVLEDFDTDIENSKTAAKDAQNAADTVAKEADKAENALNAAKEAETSAAAKEQEEIAKETAAVAQDAADIAKSEAQTAKDAYVKAEKAYNEALKEAAAAQKEASDAINAAEKDAEQAAQKAVAAEEKVQELKGEVEAAREKAEGHFTEKEAALSQAQQELAAAKENLTEVATKEEVAREELLTATEAVVETGAFLVAAEAYEALAEITVEGLELAITAMEDAKEAADKALADAEAALEKAEGNEAEAQVAYDAALAAYNTANATLEQANAELEAAKAEQEATDAFANSEYGQKLTAIEKELIEANNAGNDTLVAQKTQELIATVIKYDQNSSEAKYDSVELVDRINKIYEAKDAEGNAAYYQYVQNADGSFSFFECNKKETATIVEREEIVTELPSFEGMNEWEYEVIELDGGSYKVIYYDVKNTENVYTSEEDAKNSIATGESKEIYAFDIVTEEIKEANKFTETAPIAPIEPTKPMDLENFLEENNISKPVDWETYMAQKNITEPTKPTEPTAPETERPVIEAPTEPTMLDSKYYSGPWYNRKFDKEAYKADCEQYEKDLADYNDVMGEWSVYDSAYEQYKKDLWTYENISEPAFELVKAGYITLVDTYKAKVASYDADYAAYLEEKAQYDADMVIYNENKVKYDAAFTAYITANATRNAALKECYDNGNVLTIVVDGEVKTVRCDKVGLYYEYVEPNTGTKLKIYDINDYTVKVTNKETNYRVVEYKETVNTSYDLVDTTADDSYENVTQQVETAKNNFEAASDKVNTATADKNTAQATEQAKASELATAEETLVNMQKVHDNISKVYDAYYGNEEVEFEIPEDIAKAINIFGITDTSTIVSLLDTTGIFDTLGIDASESYFEITEDGQVTIEIPGTSQYVQHMVALELAKVAAEENLKVAQKMVEERRVEHSAAVANLEVKAAEYGEAVKELADAAIKVGKAELKVGMATVELTAAEAALEACKVAEAYATDLVLKAQEARVKAEQARQLVETLKNDITVGSEELAAAEDALKVAETELALAEQAAVDAQHEADAAKAAYAEITNIVAELEDAEKSEGGSGDEGGSEDGNKPSISGTPNNSGSSSDSSDDSLGALAPQKVSPSQSMVTIDEEYVPLAETFMLGDMAYVDVTSELVKGTLSSKVLQRYYGQRLYMMAHMGNGVGYTIDAANLVNSAADLQLLAYLEPVENFAEGFTTMHYVPAKEVILSYNVGIHMQLGVQHAGKPVYIFSKNRVTGLYEACNLTNVSENGNVAVQTKEMTEMMIMIME